MAVKVHTYTKVTEQVESLADIKAAVLAAAEKATAENPIEVVVSLDKSNYNLTEPIVFSVEENPSLANIKLTLRAKPSMRPVIFGGTVVPVPDMTAVEGTPYYKYQLEKDENGEYPKFHDVYWRVRYAMPTRLKMAKSPVWRNPFPLLPEQRTGEAPFEGLYVPVDIAKQVKSASLSATELRMYVQWEHTILHVKDVDLSVTKEAEGKTYALVTLENDRHARCVHRENNTGNRETFFTNSLAFLTEPGSYVYDWNTGTVYIYPPEGPLADRSFVYSTLENLITFRGMKGVTVEGITFTGVTSSYVCRESYHAQLTNVEVKGRRLPHAAVMCYDMTDFTFRDCTVTGVGGSGILLWGKNREIRIYDNKFTDVAMVAVGIGDYIGRWTVPNGRTESAEVMEAYFRTIAYDVSIVNNYFEHIAYDYPNCAAIYVCFADCLKITHNTIENCAYSGIAAGWAWSPVYFVPGEQVNLRDTEIAYNRIHNFMDLCRDGGAIYVTGANASWDIEERFNTIHHNLATLDDQGSKDRRGYYLDGSATSWDVYDYVIHNCSLPLFTQYHVRSQYTHHNRMWNIYSTTPIDEGNHAPWRDTILGECYVVPEGLDALYERYPEAKAIADATGCTGIL